MVAHTTTSNSLTLLEVSQEQEIQKDSWIRSIADTVAVLAELQTLEVHDDPADQDILLAGLLFNLLASTAKQDMGK